MVSNKIIIWKAQGESRSDYTVYPKHQEAVMRIPEHNNTEFCLKYTQCYLNIRNNKRKCTLLDRTFSILSQTHSFVKYLYIKTARLTRQPYKHVLKLFRR